MSKLVKLLRRNHAIEVGAYTAYDGHYKSLPEGSPEYFAILAIQEDEKTHKESIEAMLKKLKSKPSVFLDSILWFIGGMIGIGCHFFGYRLGMWGAMIMEKMGSYNYRVLAKHALVEGYPEFAPLLEDMQKSEEAHEEYFKTCLAPSKGLVQRN